VTETASRTKSVTLWTAWKVQLIFCFSKFSQTQALYRNPPELSFPSRKNV